MKKAFVLLLALAVLGGAAFAQEPSISGSATLSWGIDLDTQATGFKNEATLSVTFPIYAENSPSKGGEGDVYGYIEITDLAWDLTEGDGGFASDFAGSVTAKLVFKPFELSVNSKPSLAINKAAEIDSGEVDYAGVGTFGTALKYISDSFTGSVKILSAEDWTTNTANDYAIGSDLTFVVPDLMKINASVAYDLSGGDSNFYAGVDAPVTLADILYGLTFTPAADFIIGDPLAYDAMAKLALNFAEENEDEEQTNLAFKAYYSNADENMEISLSFDEYLVGGLVDNAEFGFAFKTIDFIGAAELPWAVETYAGYKFVIDEMNDLYGRVDFDIDSANVKNLTAKVVFTNIAVANTTFTVTYESKNLLADPAGLGTIIAAAKIKY